MISWVDFVGMGKKKKEEEKKEEKRKKRKSGLRSIIRKKKCRMHRKTSSQFHLGYTS